MDVGIGRADGSRVLAAELNYYAAIQGKPRAHADSPPPGIPACNFGADTRSVTIRDLRFQPDRPLLDREGFAVAGHASAERDFVDPISITGAYYEESARVLMEATGAAEAFVFDHTIRRPGAARGPFTRVHADQTDASGAERVRRHMGARADALLRDRVRIVNLWRPIRGPVRDHPLAVADARSVPQADLVPTDLVYADWVGEIHSVLFNPEHEWFYVSDMLPDEILLLKCYDSLDDGRARFSPHAAFVDPTAPADTPPRESIEVRALLFG